MTQTSLHPLLFSCNSMTRSVLFLITVLITVLSTVLITVLPQKDGFSSSS